MSSKTPEEQNRIRAAKKTIYYNNHERFLEKNRAYSASQRVSQPWRKPFNHAKYRSRKRNKEFTITPEWCVKRFNGKCEITGINFVLGKRNVRSPSLDRIDNARGYTTDNCRFILHAINSFKSDGTDTDMYEIAAAITVAHKG